MEPGCPATPFAQVSFTTSSTTIFITAPGISSASCEPQASSSDNAAKLDVSPNSLNFGDQAVKSTSSPQMVTIKNVGTDDVNVIAYAVFGDFAEDNDCPRDAECRTELPGPGYLHPKGERHP